MKKIILSFIIIPVVLVMSSISGCYYDSVIPDVTVYTGAEIAFAADIMPIFDKGCNVSGCHSPGDEVPDLTAPNAYNSLIDGDYIDFQNPKSSELYQWVNGNRGTTMPISGTDPKIASTVLSWIEQGALNN